MTILISENSITNTGITDTLTSGAFLVDGASTVGYEAGITVSTPSASTFLAGVVDVDTWTLPAKAAATGGDHVIFFDTTGASWAFALNKSGTDPVPTGALYTAVAAARKVNVDISADTTATNVCDRVRTALNALSGYSAVFTTSGTTTLINTQVVRGVVTASVPYNLDESGAGSITIVQTTAGVASAVDIVADAITKAAHGLPAGLKGQLTSTGTLPAGLSTSTDYFVISIDTNTYALASSLANAQAGTKINITDQGTAGATHTFTPTAIAGATVKLQYTMNDASLLAGSWIDVAAATSITITANLPILISMPAYKYIRYIYTITAGSLTAVNYIRAINNNY